MADPTDPAHPGTPVPGWDYPADLAQLRAWFSSEEACLDYVDWLRWPCRRRVKMSPLATDESEPFRPC